MATEAGTLERLSEELGLALAPLEDLLTADNIRTLFLELGVDDPPSLGGDPAFVQKLGDAVQRAIALGPQIEAVAEAADGDDAGKIVSAAADLLETIIKLGIDIDAIATDIQRAAAGSGAADEMATFATVFAERLLGDIAIRYLETSHPMARELLSLLTIIDLTPVLVLVDGQPVEVVRRRLYFDRLGRLFSDPLGMIQDGYKWGREDFDGALLLRRLSSLFQVLGPLAVVSDADVDGPVTLDLLGVTFSPTTDAHPPGLDGELHAELGASIEIPIAHFGEYWRLALLLGGSFSAGLKARLLPPASLTVQPPTGELEGDVTLRFIGEAPVAGTPFVLFGETAGTRLQAEQVLAGVGTALKWDLAANAASADVGMEIKVVQGKFIITTGSADGFIKKILPPEGITLEFEFTLGWSESRGFYFTGSGGLETTLPVHITIGPIHIDMVHLRVNVSGEGLILEVTIDGGLLIGPVAASVERIGIGADLKFSKGNLGP